MSEETSTEVNALVANLPHLVGVTNANKYKQTEAAILPLAVSSSRFIALDFHLPPSGYPMLR